MNTNKEWSCGARPSAIGLLAAVLLLHPQADSREREGSAVRNILGFETDVFPILSEGYHISIWYGFSHTRFRAFVAKDHIPQFAVRDGFKNNIVQSYALMIDFFPESGFRGFWISIGTQYWDATVSLDGAPGTADYTNTVLSISGGYMLPIWDNLYISPAVGVHVRIGGTTEVDVAGNLFAPSAVVPDFFIRLGWHF